LQATVVENGVRETYRARYYNPTTGRFLSEDPIGFEGSGTNLYAYASENPLRFTDPSGMCLSYKAPRSCGELKDQLQNAAIAASVALLLRVVLLEFAVIAAGGLMSFMFLGIAVGLILDVLILLYFVRSQCPTPS
jgi:RHS repeat-associated protein